MLRIASALAIGVALFWTSPAAQAQPVSRTWVSGVGADTNPCTRTAPCKTFQGALINTASGGEIDTLDPGDFGPVTISQPVTIAQEGTGEAGIASNGITIDLASGGVVILRGLQIFGGGVAGNGVQFSGPGVLMVQNCVIRNFGGAGIDFAPSGGGLLYVSDTTISNNSGEGVLVQPPSATAQATLTRVHLFNNEIGVKAAGKASVVVFDSVASSNTEDGIVAGGTSMVEILHSTIAENHLGLRAETPKAILRIGDSVVTGNAIGATIASGATMTSYGNNQIDDNTSPGATIPITPLR